MNVPSAHASASTIVGAMLSDLPETSEEEALDLPWNVVVHNDPVNLMTYVTHVFRTVFGFPKDRAIRHMLEVHNKGRSVVWSGAREQAEFYVEQLHGHLLLATIERPGK